MTDRELMQQALEKLEFFAHMKGVSEDTARLITALRERLAQPLVSSDGTSTWVDAPQRPVTPREMQPCAGRNCGSTNPNLHSAECFEDYEKSTGMAQSEQKPIDSAEKASAYLDARLWEFIDMAAAWPQAKPDPRTWGHVLVYAPKRQEPVAWLQIRENEPPLVAPRNLGTPVYTTPPQRKPPQFPTMLRKMWSGAEVQKWINENWNAAHGIGEKK